jgi:hypothetical protein
MLLYIIFFIKILSDLIIEDRFKMFKKKIKIKSQKKIKPKSELHKIDSSIENPLKLPKDAKIFQIGFNRCATQSIANALQQHKIQTIHNNWKSSKICYRNFLAIVMQQNFVHPFKDILSGDIDKYQAFLDIEYVYDDSHLEFYSHFKDMDQEYPNSVFIMNIRPVQDWIFSRMKLGKLPDAQPYYKYIDDSKIKRWIQHYFEHSIKVRDYFIRDHPLKKYKLIIFSLGHSKLQDLIQQIEKISSISIYKPSKPIEEKVDFIHFMEMNPDEKKLSPSLLSYIEELTQKHGDPSQISWWK